MKRLFGTSLIALALMTATSVQAQNCSVAQFKGVYSALAKGEFLSGIPVPPQLLGPTTRVARVEVDGKGNSKLRAITSLNGVVINEEYGGIYTVNPDCTTTTTLFIPFPDGKGGNVIVPFTFSGVLSDNFQQLDIMLLDPTGSTIIINLRQQNKANCSVGDLSGGYRVEMRGFTGLPFGPALPFARLGRIAFDGKGSFSAQTNISNGGAISTDAFSGSYTVDSSCEFTIQYGGNTWAGMLMDNSTGANVMVTGPTIIPAPPFPPLPVAGVVISGTLEKQ
jgi:hypothetical protein